MRVLPPARLRLAHVDLSGPSTESAAQRVQRIGDTEQARSFDLSIGPLLRATLLRLAENDHVLLLCMHHIIEDGWSGRVLLHDITQLYRCFNSHDVPLMSPLPIQYADFSRR
jgi:hypothetical protein